jgi:phosphate transport system substrate-binding protein
MKPAWRFARPLVPALIGLTAVLAAPVATALDVSGSGSTFVHAVMLRWAADYFDKSGVAVSYDAIGSSAGVRELKDGKVTFCATDRPLLPMELVAAGLAQFPIVVGGIVPVVNLDGIKSGQLNLTGEVMADIFLGKITNWNDASIAALNPGTKLPDLAIRVAYRSDGSGSTFNLTNYLSKISPEWKAKVGEGNTVNWPVGTAHDGSEGLISYVGYVRGAIGYVQLSYGLKHNLVTVRLRNRSGAFIAPTADSFRAAATTVDWLATDFYEVLTDAPGKDAWPITATTFVLMPRHPAAAEKSRAALKFFRWALEEGQDDAKGLRYVPMTADLVKRIEEYWDRTIK